MTIEKPKTPGDSGGAPTHAETGPQLLSPLDWGRQLGKITKSPLWFGEQKRGEIKAPDYLHAEYLHGWIEAELRGRPDGARKLFITREDFEAALKAAMTADEKSGAYTPHQAALAAHLRGNQ